MSIFKLIYFIDQYFHTCGLIAAFMLHLKFACETMRGLKVWFNPQSTDSYWPTGEPALSCFCSSAEKSALLSLFSEDSGWIYLKQYSD